MQGMERPQSPTPHQPGDGMLDFGDDFSNYTYEERLALASAIRENKMKGIPLNPLLQRYADWSAENTEPDNDVPWKR